MTDETAARPPVVRAPRFGLSGKLLVLTILFVMIAEVLIYVPLVANFRVHWLRDHLAGAYTAALVLEAAPSGMVPESLAKQILDSIGARAVAMKMGTSRRLLAIGDAPPPVTHDFDMREVYTFDSIVDAFMTMLDTKNDVMRVVGPAPMGGDFIELVMDEPPLRKAMLRYSVNLLLLSLLVIGIAAAFVYLVLHYLFVRPMRRITGNMVAFRADPENADRIIVPSGRADEIGTAEQELATMQAELASMLQQKNRLAALGLAVSKINHDLRNLLGSAQLISDRLSSLPDPGVQRFAPKLMRALERAIAFCQSTLSYGRLQEPPPERRPILLEPLVDEVHETLGLGPDAPVRWISAVERGLVVEADYDQLFRSLLNLARNALQALESRAARDPGRDQIRITGRREGAVVVIEVSDTGPGFSERARAHLFEAFQGSTRTGGAGLGLAIAAELIRAHGGEIRLVEGTIGATLRLTIPDRAVELSAHRGARAHG
ncbi:MAG TPA: HAMP domain-containing sensor histidine kinase [Xanthobacteraceae bacterium]|jgi:signal transduction histidine kinase|nr:HAMP domain-containing sensor histidine kinase [Xanthobacteraceae bacterium]